jgi:hypothetical protein
VKSRGATTNPLHESGNEESLSNSGIYFAFPPKKIAKKGQKKVQSQNATSSKVMKSGKNKKAIKSKKKSLKNKKVSTDEKGKNRKSSKRNKKEKSKKFKSSAKNKKIAKNKKNKSAEGKKKKSRTEKSSRQSGGVCLASNCMDLAVYYIGLLSTKVANYQKQLNRIGKLSNATAAKLNKQDAFAKTLNQLITSGGGNLSNISCENSLNNTGDCIYCHDTVLYLILGLGNFEHQLWEQLEQCR